MNIGFFPDFTNFDWNLSIFGSLSFLGLRIILWDRSAKFWVSESFGIGLICFQLHLSGHTHAESLIYFCHVGQFHTEQGYFICEVFVDFIIFFRVELNHLPIHFNQLGWIFFCLMLFVFFLLPQDFVDELFTKSWSSRTRARSFYGRGWDLRTDGRGWWGTIFSKG